jgi:hypothetical protein
MESDEELRDVYIECRESTDDMVESALLKNIQAGDQRAIEFYLTNRRSSKWRSARLLQEQDSSEGVDIEAIYQGAIANHNPAARDTGEDVGIPGFDQNTREMDRKLLERPK